MKITCFILAAFSVGGMVFASEPPNWAQAKAAAVIPDDCHCLKDTSGLGLGVGSWLNSRWGLEVDALRISLQSHDGGIRNPETEVQGALLFAPFDLESHWKPYLRVGGGVVQVQTPFSLGPGTTIRPVLHGGLGLQGWWGDHGFGSVEVRSISIYTATSRRETQAILGLGLRWGQETAKLEAPLPVSPQAPVSAPVTLPVQPPIPTPTPLPIPVTVSVPEPTPVPIPPAVPLPPLPAPAALRIVLDDAVLHFANNRADIPPPALDAIRQVALELIAFPGPYSLVITGHTSSDGSVAHNRELSQRRAKAVAEILVSAGLSAERMTVVGWGPDRPIADNATPVGKAKNRRVEIDIQAEGVDVQHLNQ